MKLIAAVVMTLLLQFVAVPVYASGEPIVHGEAAYLMDVQSGQVLYSKNGDEELPPASTTKIMTALLALEKGNLNDQVTAGPTLLDQREVYGTQIYLAQGEQMSLKDLLYAVLLNSANDAAVAVAEHIGGSLTNFVQMMNTRAAEIGMTRTHFVNPTGLNAEGHFTTAHDLALLARVAYQNARFLNYSQTKTQPIPRTTPNSPVLMVNENKLLWRDSDVNGMKTGYTSQAQNCLVASAERNGRQLVGVILKSPGAEMFSDMQVLLNYGFENFNTSLYQKAGTKISSLQIGQEEVGLLLAKDIYRTGRVGTEPPSISLTLANLRQGLDRVKEGEKLGQVEVWQGNSLLGNVDVLADRSVAPPKMSARNYLSLYLITVLLTALTFILLYGAYVKWARLKQSRSRKRGEA